MLDMYGIVDTQCEIIRLQSNAIDEMMALLVRYMDLDEMEHLKFLSNLNQAREYREEIDM